MRKNVPWILNKKEHIEEQIAALKNKEIGPSINGADVGGSIWEIIAFQKRRIALLDWIVESDDDEILKRLDFERENAKDGILYLAEHGHLAEISPSVVEHVALYELLIYSMGIKVH